MQSSLPPSSDFPDDACPELVPFARVQRDRITGAMLILYPEGALELSDSAYEIVHRCDGTRSVTAILDSVAAEFEIAASDARADVFSFLGDLRSRGLLSLRQLKDGKP